MISGFEFRRVESVGPKVSAELLKSGIIAIGLSLVAMLFYIWIRFEWQFSLGSIIALLHDVIITLGVFSLFNFEINLSIVAAVLTIVGYSMNDTVVIFDRVRENLKKFSDIKIFDLTNISINETLSRTIITSITTLLALLSIYFLGGEILKGFSLAMILGVVFGTYSSIYIANPILVLLNVSQGTILKDQVNADTVLIGEANNHVGNVIQNIYMDHCMSNPKICRMSRISAEITKLSLNCLLTTKISFANMIGDISDKVGGEKDKILGAIGSDSRIGSKFLKFTRRFGFIALVKSRRDASE